MQTATLVTAFVLVAVTLLTVPQTVDAECCYPHASFRCGDCTAPGPFCGVGGCNIFGCDCYGGCRKGGCFKLRSASNESEIVLPEYIVAAGDVNGDNKLSVEEAVKLLENQRGRSAAHLSNVQSLDKNNDGYLSVNEIDS